MLSIEQIQACERLYREGNHTIKQIMQETGIRSEQTVYRVLDAAGIPRRPNRRIALRATISFDEDAAKIINEVNPKNMSEWVCDIVKKYNKE